MPPTCCITPKQELLALFSLQVVAPLAEKERFSNSVRHDWIDLPKSSKTTKIPSEIGFYCLHTSFFHQSRCFDTKLNVLIKRFLGFYVKRSERNLKNIRAKELEEREKI